MTHWTRVPFLNVADAKRGLSLRPIRLIKSHFLGPFTFRLCPLQTKRMVIGQQSSKALDVYLWVAAPSGRAILVPMLHNDSYYSGNNPTERDYGQVQTHQDHSRTEDGDTLKSISVSLRDNPGDTFYSAVLESCCVACHWN